MWKKMFGLSGCMRQSGISDKILDNFVLPFCCHVSVMMFEDSSTTVKIVAMDSKNKIVYKDYQHLLTS